MRNFIEEFYYGNINPQARSLKKDSRIQKALDVLGTHEELLGERLEGEEKRLFLAYTNAWDDVLGNCDAESFIVGFRLGARFAYNTFVDDNV